VIRHGHRLDLVVGDVDRCRLELTLQPDKGNRVSWSLSDEAEREAVIPSGDFAFEAHGIFCG
jgi:hypothetical protein